MRVGRSALLASILCAVCVLCSAVWGAHGVPRAALRTMSPLHEQVQPRASTMLAEHGKQDGDGGGTLHVDGVSGGCHFVVWCDKWCISSPPRGV